MCLRRRPLKPPHSPSRRVRSRPVARCSSSGGSRLEHEGCDDAEPSTTRSRLTLDMTDAHRSTTPAAHAAHDLTVVAALAARADDLDEKAVAAARRQVAECTACADLL